MKISLKIVGLIGVILTCTISSFARSSSRTGYLGVYLERLDRSDKKELGITHGILVTDIQENSPAEKAGIQPDDVILYFNDKKIRTPEDLTRYVQQTKPDTKITLTINRDGKKKELTVVLGKKRRSQFLWYRDLGKNTRMFSTGNAYLGVKLQALNKDLATYFHTKENSGALILEVMEDSPASDAGLMAGDIIIQMDGDPIETPEDVTDILTDFDAGDSVDIQILRQDSKKEFSVELNENPGQLLDFRHLPMMHDREFRILIPDIQYNTDGCVMEKPGKDQKIENEIILNQNEDVTI